MTELLDVFSTEAFTQRGDETLKLLKDEPDEQAEEWRKWSEAIRDTMASNLKSILPPPLAVALEGTFMRVVGDYGFSCMALGIVLGRQHVEPLGSFDIGDLLKPGETDAEDDVSAV